MNDQTVENTSTAVSQQSPVELFQRIVHDFMEEGKGIKDRIDNAKTETKRKYFKKKLIQNNKMLANVIIMLEKYKAQETTATQANNPQV